jgi:hypothetical protein
MQLCLPIETLEQLGQAVRATRKWQHLRQDEVGKASHSFILDLEMGKPTAQIGKVLETLRELGIQLYIELPSGMELDSVAKARQELP